MIHLSLTRHTKTSVLSKEIDTETFKHLWKLAKISEEKTGIMIIDGFDYWEKYSPDYDPWFKTLCPEVK